jgi:hypothetical protein
VPTARRIANSMIGRRQLRVVLIGANFLNRYFREPPRVQS